MKKVIMMVATAAVVMTAVKTGYAFYENQVKNVKKNVTYAKEISVAENNLKESAKTEVREENQSSKESEADDPFYGCGSGYGSMLDENGNFKDRETFEKELDGSVQDGNITEEDKEYYLFMYDKCSSAFSGSTGDTGSDDSTYTVPPSCH